MEEEPKNWFDQFAADMREVCSYLFAAVFGFGLFYVIFHYVIGGIDVRSSIRYAIMAGSIWAFIGWLAQILPEDILHQDLFKYIKKKKKK